MVDPISIISLVAITLHASKVVYELIEGTKDAPQDIQELARDSVAIHDVLIILKKYLDYGQAVESNIETGLRLPLKNTMVALEQLAAKIKPFIDSKTLKWKNFRWALKQREIDGLKRELKSSQATLAMALSILLKSETSTINTHTQAMMGTQSTILELVKSFNTKLEAGNAAVGMDHDRANPTDLVGLSKYLESVALARYSPPPTNAAGMSTFDEDFDDGVPPPELAGHRLPALAKIDKEVEITKLLCQSPDQGMINDEGQTALHLAAQEDCYLTQMVINHGFQIDETNIEGETPLMSAIIVENIETTKLLLKQGADVNAVNDSGRSPLHYAAIHNRDAAVTELLLRRKVDTRLVDERGQTPLFAAAFHGNDMVCRKLLENGASAGSHEENGWTALHCLAMRGNSAFMGRLLSDEGPDVEAFYDPERFGLQNTVAHDTSSKRKIALVKLFLENGIDINATSKGYTALHLAALTAQDYLVTALLCHGAAASDVNLVCLNWGLSTENLNGLLERGASVDASDSKWHKTPLIWASETGSPEAVKALLDHGASVNAQDLQGISALRYAAANARTGTVKMLLEKGADPSLPDGVGRTPLIAAAWGRPFSLGGRFYDPSPSDRAKTVSLLLEGADTSARDIWGGSALHYAIENGYLEVLKVLYMKGKCDLRSERDGKSPLQIAVEREQGPVVKWLKTQLLVSDESRGQSGVDAK